MAIITLVGSSSDPRLINDLPRTTAPQVPIITATGQTAPRRE